MKLFERNRPRTVNKLGTTYLLTGSLKDHEGNPFHGTSAKSGQNKYYLNQTPNPLLKKRVKKDEIEAIAINRLKQFFQESGTLQKVFTAALNNRLIGVPLFEEEIPRVKRKIKELETVIERFSDSIRRAALEPSGDLAKVCATLTNEKEKAETELTAKMQELEQLTTQKDRVLARFCSAPTISTQFLSNFVDSFFSKVRVRSSVV